MFSHTAQSTYTTGNVKHKHNTETHFCNQFCRGKAISFTYSEWMSAAFVTQHAMRIPIICGLSGFTVQDIYKRTVRFQKLTRNLFLILHRHNVHLQQRQVSKFLMRYQQFASHAYCGAAGPVSKMASQKEKAFCVLRIEVSRSVITVQQFPQTFGTT